jgi:SAM-dependent methyltransferase
VRPEVLRGAYDRFADRYDAQFTDQQTPKIKALFARLPSPLPQPAVDLGAGTGLAHRLTGAPLIALDLSAAMLRHASGPRVQADMARLPFADGSLGCALAVTSLIDFDDPRPVVRAVSRALKPGGVWALSVLKREHVERLDAALRAHFTLGERLDLGPDWGWVAVRGG